ncbi:MULTISPECIES: hypothetical protein [unclassified Sinorhizobium]|uniref:hypothetical protein n=1 Tax=unclassified Sinorhizobium TaxID=2613772 RepID=UPI003524C3B1
MVKIFALLVAVLTLLFQYVTAASAEEPPIERTVRYAVLMENADPFFAEVRCRTDRRCELVDHKNPDIQLSLEDGYMSGKLRLSASCNGLSHCFVSPEANTIDLRQGGNLLKFGLSEGPHPGRHAVLLNSRLIGQIIIAY